MEDRIVGEREKVAYGYIYMVHIYGGGQTKQQCGIILVAYSLARKLAIRIETRPNNVTR